MNIDLDQIRALLQVVSQTDVVELSIESGEEKVTIRKSPVVVASTVTLANPNAPQMAPQPAAGGEISFEPKPEPQQLKSESPAIADLVPVTSPMVGTFYRSSSPTTQPFVQIGDRISVGQTVCIIEAMKLMNDMPSEVSGKIIKVCVDNGSTVEYGQQLFLVDPKGLKILFEKILIANRGEIALRVIRACRELNIRTVAVYSQADADSLHVKLADEAFCIGPPPGKRSYLHIPALISAAVVTGADAIHPGYGFLSENSYFAEICKDHRIKFIGPSAKSIQSMGTRLPLVKPCVPPRCQ